MSRPNASRRKRRAGTTLIDVATGSMLLAILLIPALKMMTDSQSSHARLERHSTMLFEARHLIESKKIALTDPVVFNNFLARGMTSETRTIAVEDDQNLAAMVQVTSDPAFTTPGRLMTINVIVWQDRDGDARWDSDEPQEQLRSQWTSL